MFVSGLPAIGDEIADGSRRSWTAGPLAQFPPLHSVPRQYIKSIRRFFSEAA